MARQSSKPTRHFDRGQDLLASLDPDRAAPSLTVEELLAHTSSNHWEPVATVAVRSPFLVRSPPRSSAQGESREQVVGGGAALFASELISRRTHDLDLFTCARVDSVTSASAFLTWSASGVAGFRLVRVLTVRGGAGLSGLLRVCGIKVDSRVRWRVRMAAGADPAYDAVGALDERIPSWFYWQLTLLATIGGFLFGYDTANIGSVLSFIPYQMSDLVTGYLVAGASLGAAAGAFLAGPLTDRFGRKSLLIADAGVYALGAILSAVAWNIEVLLVARTLIGLAIGADSAIATAYIAEYAPRRRRGSLSILQQWMITVGIFAAYLVALIVLWSMPDRATGLDWRLILGLGAVPAVVALVLRTRMPESPRWLIRRGRFEDARKAFGMLGMEVSDEQVRESARRLEEAHRSSAATPAARPGTSGSRWTAGVRRALAVVVVFFIFQQITGINVPFYYGPKIMSPFFEGGTAVESAITGVAVTAVMAAVNVAATYFAFRFIDRIGRRRLALSGFAGMGLFMLIGAVGNAAVAGVAQVVVVMIALDMFIVAFAIGVGGTGWLIQGEYFPTEIRARAASFGAVSDWLANFALILVFPALLTAIGLSWVMVIFTVLCLCAVAFVAGYIPETKELSVEEINRRFGEAAAHGVLKPSGRGGPT